MCCIKPKFTTHTEGSTESETCLIDGRLASHEITKQIKTQASQLKHFKWVLRHADKLDVCPMHLKEESDDAYDHNCNDEFREHDTIA